MDNSAALSLLDDLTTNIDDLTTSLQPLLSPPIQTTASTLPLFEKAKLYTLSTYAIESLLFSYIRLNASSSSAEADARTHPVFTELKRVQQYMQKIEAAENPNYGRRENMSLNRVAAGRFIKAGLAGNERFDAERRQREEEQRAGAKRKLEELNAKVAEGNGEVEGSAKKKSKKAKNGKKVADTGVGEDGMEMEDVVPTTMADASPKKKKKKRSKKGAEGT
jgi:exosome complex protein LRP1